MKKLLLGLVLTTNLFTGNMQANNKEKSVPVSQIQALQGIITESNSPEYTFISTNDGNGWAIGCNNDFAINDNVIIVFDNMGTPDIYDDEIIAIFPQ